MNKKHEISNKFHYILLISALIIGIIVRFWGLGEKSLWGNEGFSYLVSSQKTFWSSFIYMLVDLSPPAYYMFLYWWIKLFGNSEFILKLPSFIVGVVSIIAIYFSTKKVFNKKIALSVTILTSFSPVLLYYSQEVRCYSFYILFCIIIIPLWIQIINKINNDNLDSKILIKYALSSLAVIFTQYVGLLLVFFQCLYLIFFALLKKIKIKKLLKTFGIIFGISGVFLIIHYSLLNKFASVLSMDVPRAFNGNYYILIFNQIFYENYVFFLIIIIFLLLNLNKRKKFLIQEITTNKLNSPVIYLIYIIIFPIIAFLIVDKYSAFLKPKHVIFIVPATYLLLSFIIYSFDSGKELIKNIFVFSLSLIFLGIYLFVPKTIGNRTFTYYNMPKQEWRESTKYIIDNADKDTVILTTVSSAFYYTFYFKKFDKERKKLNIIVDLQLFDKKTINQKIKIYRKKYKKVYLYSSLNRDDFVEKIKNAMNAAKSSCNHLEHENFIDVEVYKCY
jgi:uncharacterized membrane protein